MTSVRVSKSLVRLLLPLLCAASGHAQVDRGGIVGTVTDTSRAVVPGVAVSLTESGTGQVTKVTSEADGDYAATLLRIGTYTVTAEAVERLSGCKPSRPSGLGPAGWDDDPGD
jgi:hypothetical protein